MHCGPLVSGSNLQAPETPSDIVPQTIKSQIYPNPTSADITVVFLNIQSDSRHIRLYSMAGQKVMEQEVNGEIKQVVLQISHLSKGTYYMHIDSNTEQVVKMIIKQ